MLKQLDFFCAENDWNKEWSNPNGNGLQNDFELQQDGKVVYDRSTGLMWERSGSGMLKFANGEEHIQTLRKDHFAGYYDWRLPTLEEAMSLMESMKLNGDLYIDSNFDDEQKWIWTADELRAGLVWVVSFDNGYCSFGSRDNLFCAARAVRDGQ